LIAARHGSVDLAGSHCHLDLDRALQRLPAADWAEAVAAARELGAEGAFADGLRLSEAGGRLVTELGLAGCHDVTAPLRGPDAPLFALGWLAVLSQPRPRDRVRLLLHKLFPSRALVRMRQAQAGDTGPMIAWYMRRWVRLIAAAPAAIARTREAVRRRSG
jgi:hypothetical protein